MLGRRLGAARRRSGHASTALGHRSCVARGAAQVAGCACPHAPGSADACAGVDGCPSVPSRSAVPTPVPYDPYTATETLGPTIAHWRAAPACTSAVSGLRSDLGGLLCPLLGGALGASRAALPMRSPLSGRAWPRLHLDDVSQRAAELGRAGVGKVFGALPRRRRGPRQRKSVAAAPLADADASGRELRMAVRPSARSSPCRRDRRHRSRGRRRL